MKRKFLQFLMLAALVAVTSVAMADPPARVGRVTVTEGRVSMLVNGEEETGNLLNWPVTSENHLTTAPGARAEFRVGSAAIRLDSDSDIEVQQLDDERLSLRLNYGTASVRVRDPAMAREFEFLTPQARITLAEPATFRIDTERAPDTTTVNVYAGNARVEGAGNILAARSGKRVEVRGDEIVTAQAVRDSFDDWAAGRDRRDESLTASRYVPADMTGYEDLDNYGNWVEDREYGTVWFPRAVPSGWAPYRDGRWVWISSWGWTWVDNSPWGYAPFHYGRWVTVGGRWCWTPGRIVGRPVWSPALVGWVGGDSWSVNFHSGGPAPALGWYPLSPRDRYVPAYRVSADVERRLVWNHRSNERWRERYQERDHDGRRDGVTALPRIQFDQARSVTVSSDVRVAPQDVRNVPPLAAPPQLSAAPARPQRQDWQRNRDERERFDRGTVHQEQPRQPLLQSQPQAQPQFQAPAPQIQQRPHVMRTDDDERGSWREQRLREQERRSFTTTTAPQPQLQAAPPQQAPRVEQRHFEPRENRDVRREAPPQLQMAPARPVQVQMAPQQPVQLQAAPPQQAQPPQQHQSQQQQDRREQQRERREDRRGDMNRNDRS
ncbi:DUF6600 domain-containing protein [Pseudoduganella violaceinigra]|uniref:DUF6600 domain-containing protein n=1 Tax=Pseudoduganella violaceinigra TaxID=246602 RepID=UPI00041751AB|nr:DUF6600 domain-containing protein [Pseudoduganella violaceinigra]